MRGPMTAGHPETSPAWCGGAAGVVNQAVANQRTATSQHQGHTPPRAARQAPAPAKPPAMARHRRDTIRPSRSPAQGWSSGRSSTQVPRGCWFPQHTQPPFSWKSCSWQH